jgi:aspartyl-tRNA(Asn)/glutamyl-tRNA(Gln) amidotransferase subunit C
MPASGILGTMNSISRRDVQKLAVLSALTLSEDEMVTMQTDLTQILSYVEQLQAVDTDGVEPTYQVHSLETVTRPDEVIDYGISQKELLKNAPKQDAGSVVVPRVLE